MYAWVWLQPIVVAPKEIVVKMVTDAIRRTVARDQILALPTTNVKNATVVWLIFVVPGKTLVCHDGSVVGIDVRIWQIISRHHPANSHGIDRLHDETFHTPIYLHPNDRHEKTSYHHTHCNRLATVTASCSVFS